MEITVDPYTLDMLHAMSGMISGGIISFLLIKVLF